MSNTIIKKREIDQLVFFKQKIISPIEEVDEYELLLRLKQNSGFYNFPVDLFNEIMKNQENHSVYIKHIVSEIEKILANTQSSYSLNIDYQELYYEETFIYLNEIKDKNRIKIELTERIPQNRTNNYSELVPLQPIVRLKNQGFKIVLDDFLSGVNTFGTLFYLDKNISRVKISILELKNKLSVDELNQYLRQTVAIFDKLSLDIVIEGIENEELLSKLPQVWKQQSYYYDKPSAV
ncbi:EAL domain-containing protein [Lactococcus lactis]|uniref:EAL domain-containing protein n=1 Tax=Lactococcus lactis TaxID=1358 RepID=UPI000C9F2D9C|nr:EAL domain-containing protein [Lactococcus lactis]AUS69140.1 diguanylate cyclase [Lactococcus lactis subsp. lactis]